MNIAPSFRPSIAAVGSVVAALSIALSGTATAASGSSFAESRGYQNCRAAADQDLNLINMDSSYYIYDRDESRSFYLNGVARLDGAVTAIRVACETTLSGHRVMAVNVENGRYLGRIIDPSAVASQ